MTTPAALTRRQQQVLDYIATALVAEHHWPTNAQLAADFNITTNAASCCLKLIERKGHITRNARGKPMLAHIGLTRIVFGTPAPRTSAPTQAGATP